MASQYSSMLAVASMYVDYKLQSLTLELRSYTTNSQQIVNETFDLGKLPPHAKCFMSDAENMYGNIHRDEGIPIIKNTYKPTEKNLQHNSTPPSSCNY